MKRVEILQQQKVLSSFQNRFDKDDWEILDEQYPELQSGWTEYYSIIYPKYKIRVDQNNSYIEVIPFNGISWFLIHQRIMKALTYVSDSQLLKIARSLNIKLI